jgi:hypothetical protein
LSVNELLALFGRAPEQKRLLGFADSEEYLAVVTYMVERSYHEYQVRDARDRRTERP